MAPYSMDLRKRVAKAWDASGDADAVAAQYDVSRAWVHRLMQRRRETGSLAPRKQTEVSATRPHGPRRAAVGGAHPGAARCHVDRVARRDPDDRGPEHVVADDRSLGIHPQKKRYTPTNNVGLMSPRRAAVADVAAAARHAPVRVPRRMRRDDGSAAALRPESLRHAPAAITRPAATGRPTRSSRRYASMDSPRRPCSTGRSTIRRSSPTSSKSWCRRCARAMSSSSTTSPSTNNPPCARRSKPSAPSSASAALQSGLQSDRTGLRETESVHPAARPRTFDHVCDLIAVALGLFTPTECRNFVRHCGYRVSTAL